ncbi:iron complex outermembrane receptor protein [Mucilaginibacter yixingensis]|uniref:Iron complex outermembrane receptor protein n=1 Tax=Mucilaginibacter yixingensis TaxID=1295612 RepID=A0A2T5J6C5_9SPHI|nr:TonB-dependent receptor [Mucilaginibacter yixingensis]PTQ93996.1 iron complex outermembrane receptor protein [Mucilaginibacter yixingensis]
MIKLYTLLLSLLVLITTANAEGPLEKSGSIRGHVQTSDGKPADFVNVGLKNTNKGTTTDQNGNYIIKGVKPGTYTIKVSFIGLQTEEKQITVSEGKPSVLNFTLKESASKLDEVSITGANRLNKPVNVGKAGLRPLDMPQSIQTIDSNVIADQQFNRLSDVMRNVNGVSLGDNRGSVNESFFARGYSLGTNNVFKNGARTSTGGMPEASTLEAVEVLKGSAALLYGGVTGGAVVNLVTKKPKFNWGGEVSMRAGSYGLYKPTVDVYGPLSKSVAFRIITTKENANSFRDVVKTDRFYVNPSLLFKISNKTELIVQGDYLKSNFTPDFGIGTVGGKISPVPRSAFLNVPWAYNNTNTGSAQANLTHRFNNNWKLNAVAAFQSYSRNYFGAERPAANAAGMAARALTRSQSMEYTYNQQINLTGSAMTGSIKHTLLFGADADQSRTTTYSFKYADGTTAKSADSINILNPATYGSKLPMPETHTYQHVLAPIYRMGAFAQDLISLTEQFKVLAGVRYTYQETPKTRTFNEETGAITDAAASTKVDKAFSPKLALIYQPISTTSLYASYANNFTPNTGVDIYNVPLGPSIIDQWEAGIKNDFLNGRLSVNVTGYHIVNNRYAQTALLTADGKPNSDTNVKEFSGKTASDGVEVDITGKLSANWYFLAGYAYNYFRYTKTAPVTGITEGERVVGSTPNTANGTIFYTFDKGDLQGLKLGFSGYYTGKRNAGFNTLKNGLQRGQPTYLTDYATFDFSAGYTFKKHLSLLAKLSNITNEINYLVHENYSVNPIAPRMVQATLSYKF